jgi:hypothetical protein
MPPVRVFASWLSNRSIGGSSARRGPGPTRNDLGTKHRASARLVPRSLAARDCLARLAAARLSAHLAGRVCGGLSFLRRLLPRRFPLGTGSRRNSATFAPAATAVRRTDPRAPGASTSLVIGDADGGLKTAARSARPPGTTVVPEIGGGPRCANDLKNPHRGPIKTWSRGAEARRGVSVRQRPRSGARRDGSHLDRTGRFAHRPRSANVSCSRSADEPEPVGSGAASRRLSPSRGSSNPVTPVAGNHRD